MRMRGILLILFLGLIACTEQPSERKTERKGVSLEQIKQDLLGKKVEYALPGFGNPVRTWNFTSPSEFVGINIDGRLDREDYLERTISMTLQDAKTRERYHCKMQIGYDRYDGKWVLGKYDILEFTVLE